ncbi:hypothetical protein ISS86_00265 [Candidatus Microgenomates bacterium]|nr:hypothetical protein [Candidatus Microgenomates bacterium]
MIGGESQFLMQGHLWERTPEQVADLEETHRLAQELLDDKRLAPPRTSQFRPGYLVLPVVETELVVRQDLHSTEPVATENSGALSEERLAEIREIASLWQPGQGRPSFLEDEVVIEPDVELERRRKMVQDERDKNPFLDPRYRPAGTEPGRRKT